MFRKLSLVFVDVFEACNRRELASFSLENHLNYFQLLSYVRVQCEEISYCKIDQLLSRMHHVQQFSYIMKLLSFFMGENLNKREHGTNGRNLWIMINCMTYLDHVRHNASWSDSTVFPCSIFYFLFRQ